MQKSISEFFGDLRMSPPFVFRELEHVLIPEFGDLILGIQHQQRSSGERQEQIPRYARDDSAAAEASCLRRIDPPAARRQAASLGRQRKKEKFEKPTTLCKERKGWGTRKVKTESLGSKGVELHQEHHKNVSLSVGGAAGSGAVAELAG
jgi:hypothetical protein